MRKKDLEPGVLWRRYLMAMSMVASFLVLTHFATLAALSGGEEATAAINISGRQRMLSQRIVALTLREQTQNGGPQVTGALNEAIALFDRSHDALIFGGDLGLTRGGARRRAAVYEASRTSQSLNHQVEAFLLDLAVARKETPGDRAEALAHLSDVERTDRLLNALDGAVKALESQAASAVVNFRRLSWLALAGALAVLLLEARFIFWPAQKAVNWTFLDMRRHRDALAASEAELKAALASSDRAPQRHQPHPQFENKLPRSDEFGPARTGQSLEGLYPAAPRRILAKRRRTAGPAHRWRSRASGHHHRRRA